MSVFLECHMVLVPTYMYMYEARQHYVGRRHEFPRPNFFLFDILKWRFNFLPKPSLLGISANPTIVSYNANAVKMYNSTNSLVRF
jgi:hypothetical protein